MNSPPASADETNSLPVCLANACMSFTEPGSVAMTLSTWPLVNSARPFWCAESARAIQAASIQFFIEIHFHLLIKISQTVKNEHFDLLATHTQPSRRQRQPGLRPAMTPPRRLYTFSNPFCAKNAQAWADRAPLRQINTTGFAFSS